MRVEIRAHAGAYVTAHAGALVAVAPVSFSRFEGRALARWLLGFLGAPRVADLQAQAVASCEASEKARDEAAAIVLLAKARIGELTKAMAKVSAAEKGRRSAKNVGSMREQTKVSALEAEGLSRKEAAECEKIADLKRSGDLDRVLAAGVCACGDCLGCDVRAMRARARGGRHG